MFIQCLCLERLQRIEMIKFFTLSNLHHITANNLIDNIISYKLLKYLLTN